MLYGNDRGEPRESQASRSSAPPKILPIETPAISLDELKRLTSNFGTKALVGEGSYGRVFSATLSTGEFTGVKKLDPGSAGAALPRFSQFGTKESRLLMAQQKGSSIFMKRYAMTGQLTQKSDVYSFGIVLLELLTGRKPVDHTMPKGQQSLVTWATPRLSEDKVKQCIDPKLNNDFLPKAMAKVSFPLPLILEFQTMN
ncbi:hypothetical protein IFM89_012177 [Coptis chinensis]|uniref:Serine-threonine/tyrosine-protein kinase catalytic domain-containing protein n=1 Tax=Coptis chinensis TaxID=261450 RepID=A0A835HDQ5_9MAGN|nr:hypothetical protein IFM89_012177 [Coptis chinensis]